METYLANLPPSLGWLSGHNVPLVYHLIVDFDGCYYKTLCGCRLRWPVLGQYHPADRYKEPLCRRCTKAIDRWRRANTVEPQSNTE